MKLRSLLLATLLLAACNSVLGNTDHHLVDATGGADSAVASAGTGDETGAVASAGAAASESCAGVVCDTPPAADCVSDMQFRSYDKIGSCQAGACSYAEHLIACHCQDGMCTTDPCVSVTCASPPASSCSENALTTYAASGTCSEGACSYKRTDKDCGSNQQCGAGACSVCKDDTACGPSCAACDAATPLCQDLGGTSKCVACLQQSDCASATASACVDGACAACTKDEDCSGIPRKPVCNAGTCVECTAANEDACAGKSCNAATNTCTRAGLGSLASCQPCLADSECVGGNLADPDARCAPMNFMGTPHGSPGGYCLMRASKTCVKPYVTLVSGPSLSGAASEAYCGVDQALTTCEAVLDGAAHRTCSGANDAKSCGCARDAIGACVSPGQGGLCETFGGGGLHCTYACNAATQCSGLQSCIQNGGSQTCR